MGGLSHLIAARFHLFPAPERFEEFHANVEMNVLK